MKPNPSSFIAKLIAIILLITLIISCTPAGGDTGGTQLDPGGAPPTPPGDNSDSPPDDETELGSGPILPEELEIDETGIEIVFTLDGGYQILLPTGYWLPPDFPYWLFGIGEEGELGEAISCEPHPDDPTLMICNGEEMPAWGGDWELYGGGGGFDPEIQLGFVMTNAEILLPEEPNWDSLGVYMSWWYNQYNECLLGASRRKGCPYF